MTRVLISDFGIIQKGLASSVVTFYVPDSDGSPSSTKATIYAASTGTTQRNNPQTLDTNGKLAVDCYVETNVVATIDEISAATERSIRKIRQNPLEYQLPATAAKFANSTSVDAATASAAATAAAGSATSASSSATAAAASETAAETAQTAAETAQTAAETAQAAAEAASGGVLVSANDTTAGSLEEKILVNEADLALTTQNDGANETRTIALNNTLNAIGSIGGGTQDIDLDDGRAVSATVDTSETTFTFSNFKASGEDSFILYLTNGGSQTVNWPASVDWAGGNEPPLTTSGLDVLVFTTIDGGTTVYGFVAGLDMQ